MGAEKLAPIAYRNALTALANNRPMYRVSFLGDSLTQGDGGPNLHTYGCRDLAWQVTQCSNGVILPVGHGGVGGQPSPMLAMSALRDAINYRPDIVVMNAGTNNVIVYADSDGSSTPFSTLAADITTVYNLAQSVGAAFVFCNMPPRAVGVNDISLIATGNAIIASTIASLPGAVLVDWYDVYNDPANPGHYRQYWSIEGTHPIDPISYLGAQAVWNAIATQVIPGRQQFVVQNDVLGLTWTGIQGSVVNAPPANTSTRDPLFQNNRTFSQNGYSLAQCPYLFGSAYTGSGTAATISSAMSTPAGAVGNVFTVTATPNGAGTFNLVTTTGGKAIDLTMHQGKAVRISFQAGCSGFNSDNTPSYLSGRTISTTSGSSTISYTGNPPVVGQAYSATGLPSSPYPTVVSVNTGAGTAVLSANATSTQTNTTATVVYPVSCWGMTFACHDANNNIIGSGNILDPIDPNDTLGQRSYIPLKWQTGVFQNGSLSGQCYDFPLSRFNVDMAIPPTAVEMVITLNIIFRTGATSTVSISLANITVQDIGTADTIRPSLPSIGSPEIPSMTITANTTLTAAQVATIKQFFVNCASGAVTVTLPAGATLLGKQPCFLKTDSSTNAMTIATSGSDTINGASSINSIVQYAQLSPYAILASGSASNCAWVAPTSL